MSPHIYGQVVVGRVVAASGGGSVAARALHSETDSALVVCGDGSSDPIRRRNIPRLKMAALPMGAL